MCVTVAAANAYRCTARELSRLNSLANTPVQSTFSETIDGLTTLRSLHLQAHMERTMFHRVNLKNKVKFFLDMANSRLAVRWCV